MKILLNPYKMTGLAIVIIFILLSVFRISIFEPIEIKLYDTAMQYTGSDRGDNSRIVLVDIDDKSLSQLGSSPWPRNRIADLLGILEKADAALIGIHLPLIDRNPPQGLRELKSFREKFTTYASVKQHAEMTEWVLENLKQIENELDHDRVLTSIVQNIGKVIIAGYAGAGKPLNEPDRNQNMLLRNNALTQRGLSDGFRKRHAANEVALPFPELSQAAHGLGIWHLHADERMAGRSHPIFINYGGNFLPSFPLRMALAILKEEPKHAVIEENRIHLKGRQIPLTDGEMLITFRNGKSPFPRYSFADILKAEKPPSMLKGRIVLIGLQPGGSRGINTPLSPAMSENQLAAHVLDGILNMRFISRPAFLGGIELWVMIILACFASLAFPSMNQRIRSAWAAGLTLLLLIIGVALFYKMNIWFKPVHVLAPLILIYAVFSLKQFVSAGRVTKEYVDTNRLLGLGFQSQGLLDLAFDKFRKLPLENETKELIYNLGLEYERKRMINKAISVYEYVVKAGAFRDLDDRIPRLKESDKSSTMGGQGKLNESGILEDASSQGRSMIGRYAILGEMGKGSMGVVYKAMDPKINRLLAIKTIRFSDEFEEDMVHEIKERFFREAEIAGRLSHPSIVIIYDVGEFRDLTYMAMEFLEGEDLENFISRDHLLPLRKVLDIVASVAEALEFAHQAGVIHRDIKPANIMLLKNGGVKVTDFGIAKAISSSRTKTGVIMGTPNYMSPEQIMGQKIDHRSDIFSLGVLFFQLLTGETPFRGDNLSHLLYQITQIKHPSIRSRNPKIPKICEQIIDKSLAKNPDQRFKSASEMSRYIRILASKMDQFIEKKVAQESVFR